MASLGAIIAAVGPQLVGKAAAALREKGDTETAALIEQFGAEAIKGFVDGEATEAAARKRFVRAKQLADMAHGFLTACSDLEIPDDDATRETIARRAVDLAAAVLDEAEALAERWDEDKPGSVYKGP